VKNVREKAPSTLELLEGIHRVTGGEIRHFGWWPAREDEETPVDAGHAQRSLLHHLCRYVSKAPSRLLFVAEEVDNDLKELREQGYLVDVLRPDDGQREVAIHERDEKAVMPFLAGGLEEAPGHRFDTIVVRDLLAEFDDLHALFGGLAALLRDENSRVVLADEVCCGADSCAGIAVHDFSEVEASLAATGFFVRHHERIEENVAPTYAWASSVLETMKSGDSSVGDHRRTTLDRDIEAWKMRDDLRKCGKLGYEIWDLRLSRFKVRSYRSGDEAKILEGFKEAFGATRSEEHWQWKFRLNPYGGPYASLVWDGGILAAHYAGYPVPVWLGKRGRQVVHHVGDTFTHQRYRGIGLGRTSLLGRAWRHYTRQYFENRIPFAYGFNTSKIQQLGKRFLNYAVAAQVYDWRLDGRRILELCARFHPEPQGVHRVDCTSDIESWADHVFERARGQYGWLVARDSEYLKWRYVEHPDFRHYFFVVYRDGVPAGWWLARVEEDTLIVGDALFERSGDTDIAAGTALAGGISFLSGRGYEIKHVGGWFSRNPGWWMHVLAKLGFEASRQFQHLDLCITSFESSFGAGDIGRRFYFTHGDSDLF